MLTLQPPSLCKIIQGVSFLLQDGGQPVHAVATRDLLEDRFGASDAPESWMRAYLLHEDSIQSAAEDAYRRRLPGQRHGAVVLTASQWILLQLSEPKHHLA